MSERKILVLDDDENVRLLIEFGLKKMGFAVDFALAGSEAVSLYRTAFADNNKYLAAILDLNIPGEMGGVEASRQILSLDPDAMLFISSGNDYDPVMANYRDHGFAGKVTKPFLYAEFVESLKVLL